MAEADINELNFQQAFYDNELSFIVGVEKAA
jgi:hypothetical protein